MTTPEPAALRLATLDDVEALARLIEVSVRELQAGDYSAAQIEGALGSVFGVDRRLILDGTYFVLEAHGEIKACGGWSPRKTLFGSDDGPGREDQLLDPAVDAARVRAFFVHPRAARQGLGARLLLACEAAAAAAGFRKTELGATLTGERLYRRMGYAETRRTFEPLPNGETLEVVRMEKIISGDRMKSASARPEA